MISLIIYLKGTDSLITDSKFGLYHNLFKNNNTIIDSKSRFILLSMHDRLEGAYDIRLHEA
jgi:hypothetical protein